MRTAELINLLRSHDRSSPAAKAQLASFDPARRLHILGELSNWLLVELQKYLDRQAGPAAVETLEQGSIRSNIRRTLLAIQVLLNPPQPNSTHVEDHPRLEGSNVSTSRLHDNTEKILDRFLTCILIGIAPLGPRVDTTDVQLSCAKILCYCSNPLSKDVPFPPQLLFKRMMSMSATPSVPHPAQFSERARDHDKPSLKANAATGLAALLRSPSMKLQEYGLRILTSFRSLVQHDLAWDLIAPLMSVVEVLKGNLVKMTSDLPQELDVEGAADTDRPPSTNGHVMNRNGGDTGKTRGDGPSKDLEDSIKTQSKALTLLQWYLQEAGTSASVSPSLSAQANLPQTSQLKNTSNSHKLNKLKEATNTGLLIELWKVVQHVVLLDRAMHSSGEKLVMLISAIMYWWCWVFQDQAMTCVLTTGSDTLLAWYGYYIISRDHDPTSTTNTIPGNGDIKQQSSVLEYLAKLIQIMVTSKTHRSTLFHGDQSVGIVILRRTIEFLEGILEPKSTLLNMNSGLISSLDTSGEESTTSTFLNTSSYSVRIIQERPGVLEAMLGIMAGCFGHSRVGDSLMLNSELLNVLVLLLSDIRQLFSAQGLTETTVRRIHNQSLNILQQTLNREDDPPGIDNVPTNHWALGYKSLVDLIMQPLEKEVASRLDPAARSQTGQGSMDEEIGVKALRVFSYFWKHNPKGRGPMADLMAPRLHLLSMVPVLVDPTDCIVSAKSIKWRKERTLLLTETFAYFAQESGVRMNMRERWSSLLVLATLLGASMKRLEFNKFSPKDVLSHGVAQRCFRALRNFWYDRQGMVQLIDLKVTPMEATFWRDFMPSGALYEVQSHPSSASIVPILISIIAPPGIVWSSELMLCSGQTGGSRRKKPRHPLFERLERVLVEAALLLAQLSKLQECQQRLVSRPGVIWLLSRMMVERSLVGNPDTLDQGTILGTSNYDEIPRELLEKALFEALTKIMSGEHLAKSLVSNNTITELFAAVLEIDQPLYFYQTTLALGESFTNRSTNVADDNIQGEEYTGTNTSSDQILPILRQRELHQQLLQHFRTAMAPVRSQFDRIYQYIGGHRSLQDVDEMAETVYWLREYCALVFLYLMEQPNSSNPSFGGAKIDKTSLLTSESVLGVVCRMLTLELEYDTIQGAEQVPMEHDGGSEGDQENPASAQKEEAMLRRFSAGVAIQSLSWVHAARWSQQHLILVQSYTDIMTTEWNVHAQTLKGEALSGLTPAPPTEIGFQIQDRVITFPDRLILSRASSFFHTLLLGDFKEASQATIVLQDIDPDDFELLMQVLQESQMTAQFLLPDDLPFALVLRLLVCAERFMVTFIKRLAEAWIIQALGTRELKHYELEGSRCRDGGSQVMPGSHKHELDDITGESQDKRRKLEEGEEGDEDDRGSNASGEGGPDMIEQSKHQQQQEESDLLAKQGIEPDQVQEDEAESSEESIQECLVMIYETCSDPRYGSLYSSVHPFYGLIWDALRRMILHLGSVAITPRFATMLETGGEERIQEFLQILYELIVGHDPQPNNEL
ncbi:MAG: hypothetical protein J3Q66DRAFT_434895 [Benniella sp.]|nr:MAG: hypothetical protein J3Q66DRAFT_434895 [Benniella sp.]